MLNSTYNRCYLNWRKPYSVFLLAMMLLLSGCGSVVITDYDENYNFSNLKVYAWLEQAGKPSQDPLVDNDLMYGRIIDAVDAQLINRGFKLAEQGESADFFVGFHIKAEEKFHITSFDSWYTESACWPHCYSYNRFPNHRRDDVELWQYKQGVFMVDVIEPASERLVWRGIASKRLTNGEPAKRTEYVNAVVESIFTQFPAGLKTEN